jgi:hypothetical protein
MKITEPEHTRKTFPEFQKEINAGGYCSMYLGEVYHD